MTCWLAIGSHESHNAAQQRNFARSPVPVGPAAAVARYGETADVLDGRQFPVIALVPLATAAPPPPGLPRWPAPGEAWLSPALVAADRHGDLRGRYGRFAGSIAPDGLADRDELFVYYRPPDGAAATDGTWTSISGWGQRPLQPLSSGLRAPTWLTVLAVSLLVVPVVPLAVAAGSRRLRRGAPLRSARLFARTLPAATIGASVAGGLAWWLRHHGGTLSITDQRLVGAADAPMAAVHVVTVVGAAVGVALLASLRGVFADRRWAARLRTADQWITSSDWPRRLATAGTTLLILAALGAPAGQWLLLGGVLTMLLALPSITRRGTAAVGRWLLMRAERRRSPGAPAAGRWLRRGPTSVGAFAGVLALALVVPATVMVGATVTGAEERRAVAVRDTVGAQIVQVNSTGLHVGRDRFLTAVGTDRVLRMYRGDRSTVLVGTCAALARLGSGAACPTTPTPTDGLYPQWSSFGRALTTLGIIAPGPHGALVSSVGEPGELRAVLVLNADGEAGRQAIARAAFTLLPLPYVSLPGQEWLGALRYAEDIAGWMRLVALLGIIVAVVAGVLGIALGQATHRRMTGSGGTLAGSGWALLTSTLLAGVLATVTALGSAFAMRGLNGSGDIPVLVLISALPLSVVVAAIVCLLCTLESATRRHQGRVAGRRRPSSGPGPELVSATTVSGPTEPVASR
ncbi:hypothetical protein GCM10010532_081650 [Dactylosporangium siamense]|uniref:Uncharacterized protein n=2 Tax=Dactylosporangium siamense TaxID=685454 RepID=A0A919UAG5_9ACTN|nr:hypothetical protein Dsi01nite_060380 [Dactylosporangium siamense]